MGCSGVCQRWKNLINFIPGIPKYALADRCHKCKIWFPKHTLIRCPCCNNLLRIKRRKFNNWRHIRPAKSNEEIAQKIEEYMTSKRWQLIKLDVFKAIKDFEIMKASQEKK